MSRMKDSDMCKVPDIIIEEKDCFLSLGKILQPLIEFKRKQYIRGKYLGKGAFAKCYQVTCKDSKESFAVKCISKSTLTDIKTQNRLKNEIDLHQQLKCPYIVNLERCFEDNENFYILLELCEHFTLKHLLKKRIRLSHSECRFYLNQILFALTYLHKEENIIHRDLKLGNLFIHSSMNLRMGDFGLATKLNYQSQRKHSIAGTPNFLSPEIITRNSKGYSYEVDIWGVGVLAYAMLVGTPPFETDKITTTYKRIKNVNYTWPDEDEQLISLDQLSNLNYVYVSKSAKDFIQSILQFDPEKRSTLEQLQNHPFMTEQDLPQQLPLSCLNQTLLPSLSKLKTLIKNTNADKNNNNINDNNNSSKIPISSILISPKYKRNHPQQHTVLSHSNNYK